MAMQRPLSESHQRGAPSRARTEGTKVSTLRAHGLDGFVARSSGETVGVVVGLSIVVRLPERPFRRQFRIIPLEALESVSESERELTMSPPIEPHAFPWHRSLRRLGEGWRADLSLDVPLMNADYWLAHCHGFLVNAPNQDVGVVDDVLFDPTGCPEKLLVRTGGFRGRTVSLPVAEVLEIIPELRTIGVARDPERLGETGRPQLRPGPWPTYLAPPAR